MFFQSIFNKDISNWNVSNVTSMRFMFYHARDFNIDIRKWNVRNVIEFDLMFRGANKFLDIILKNNSSPYNREDFH